MGELINANRSTITLCLQELKKRGYLRTRGRKIILIPHRHMELLDHLSESVLSGGVGEAADLAPPLFRAAAAKLSHRALLAKSGYRRGPFLPLFMA